MATGYDDGKRKQQKKAVFHKSELDSSYLRQQDNPVSVHLPQTSNLISSSFSEGKDVKFSPQPKFDDNVKQKLTSTPSRTQSSDIDNLNTQLNDIQMQINELMPIQSKAISSIRDSTASRRKQKEPDTFDGNTVQFRDYIVHFERVGKWNNWSEEDMARQLAMALRGDAQKLLSDLTDDQLESYNYLKCVLSKRYDPTERLISHRCEFRSRKRLPNETPSDYAHALKRIASLAFPEIPSQYREVQIQEQYLLGLGNNTLREHVMFKNPKSLEEAVAFTIEYESIKGLNSHPNKPIQNNDSGLNAAVKTQTFTTEQLTKSDVTTLLDRLTLCIEMLEKTAKRKEKVTSAIRCYTCNTPGHLSRNCPNRHRNVQGN